jgi:hypothetical protein
MGYNDQIDRGLICAHFLYLPFTIVCLIDVLNQAVEEKAYYISLSIDVLYQAVELKAYYISLSIDVLYQAVEGKAYHISLYFCFKFQRNG